MIVKTYGLYDTVSKNFVRTFKASNDEDANRAGKYIVREKDFDPIAGCDYKIMHVYDFNTENGKVIDNDIRSICDLKEAYDEFQLEVNVREQRTSDKPSN